MSNVKTAGADQNVKLENAKGVTRSFPLSQALELLRIATKSKIKTWKLNDERFKFENNEINAIPSKGATA